MLKDGRSDFNDFITDNPNRSNLLDNKTAKKVFDFMNTKEAIWLMVQCSEQGKPAIYPLVAELENIADDEFPLNGFHKQSIGAMAACILKPFGYLKEVDGRRIGKNGFTSGAVFKRKGTPRIKIVQELSIEEY